MYIIHEENYDCLCVCEDIYKGIYWLIKNKWISLKTEGIDENDNVFQIKDIINEEKDFDIWFYLFKLGRKDGTRAVLEWLEQFGFYFHEIEVA